MSCALFYLLISTIHYNLNTVHFIWFLIHIVNVEYCIIITNRNINLNQITMKARLTLLMSFIFLSSFYLNANSKAEFIIDENQSREHFYKSKDSFSAYEIKYKGKITISNDDKDVKAIESNGYLKITKSSFGNNRRIEIESDDKGNLTKKYFDGKKELPFEADGQEWLSEILIDVIHKTGIGGKERILNIYSKGGVDAVINAAERMDNKNRYSTYKSVSHKIVYFESVEYSGFNVKYMYYKTLVNDIKLNREEVVKVLKAIPEIHSQSTKGILLREMLKKYDFDTYTMEKFLEATESLSYNTERGNTLRAFIKKYDITTDNSREFLNIFSGMSINSEKGNVVKLLLANQKLSENVLSDLIEAVSRFSLSSERAAVYRVLLPHVVGNEDLSREYVNAIKGLSDSYRYLKQELLEWEAKGKLVTDTDLDKSAVLNLLEIAETFDANTRKSVALRKLHGSMTNDKDVINTYFEVINSMDLRMEQYNLLLDFIRVHKLDSHGYVALFDVVEEMGDDDFGHGASAILRESINDLPNDPEVIRSFFDALDEIEHISVKEEIVRMICEKDKLDKRTVVYLLKTVEDIETGIGKATVLLHVKKLMAKGDSEIDYIFKSVANDIKSDYEYERTMN